MTKAQPLVYVILINFNNWADTVLCLESLFKIQYPNFKVIVVDNDSDNDSVSRIIGWADGAIDVALPREPKKIRQIIGRPVPKPINILLMEQDAHYFLDSYSSVPDNHPLLLFKTKKNLGFAGGNNLGIRLAMANRADFVWLLNNDTVVHGHALSELVKKAEYYDSSGKKVGIIGSKLLFYHEPDIIQGVGGKYNPFLALSKHIGINERDVGQYDDESVLREMDYVIGASMFVGADFLKDVGLLTEDYFLYFEELDWMKRALKKGWQAGYCWTSKVYHMEGGSIGTSFDPSKRSVLSDYYVLRNRLLFTKRFYPFCLPTVFCGVILSACLRVMRGQPRHALAAVGALRDFLAGR